MLIRTSTWYWLLPRPIIAALSKICDLTAQSLCGKSAMQWHLQHKPLQPSYFTTLPSAGCPGEVTVGHSGSFPFEFINQSKKTNDGPYHYQHNKEHEVTLPGTKAADLQNGTSNIILTASEDCSDVHEFPLQCPQPERDATQW
jgi:hypothetical protein